MLHLKKLILVGILLQLGVNSVFGQADTLSLIADPTFQKGIRVKGVNSSQVSQSMFIYPFGRGESPTWELAEWGSRYVLEEINRNQEGTQVTYQNKGKRLLLQRGANNKMLIEMDVTGANEYTRPRQAGEHWPHLLLEQQFRLQPQLAAIKNVRVQLTGQLLKSEMQMDSGQYYEGLHAAQFQLFITVQNLNKDSKGYGDFLWFGLPFYDVRSPYLDLYAAKDIGKDDATGKFIYSLASRDFMKGTFHGGEVLRVDVMLYDAIKRAFQLAQERGYLQTSAWEDLALSSMNIGWEVPGTYDVSFRLSDFDIQVIK